MFRFIIDPVFPSVFGSKGKICRLSRQFENIVNSNMTQPVETKIYRLDREAFFGVASPYSMLSSGMDKAHELVLGDILTNVDALEDNQDGNWRDTQQVLIEHLVPVSSVEVSDFVIARQLHHVGSFPRAEFAVASIDPNKFHDMHLYELSRSAAFGMKIRNPIASMTKVLEDNNFIAAYQMKNILT